MRFNITNILVSWVARVAVFWRGKYKYFWFNFIWGFSFGIIIPYNISVLFGRTIIHNLVKSINVTYETK